MTTIVTPVGNRVLVKRIEADATTASGLVLPKAAKERIVQAEVVRVGHGRVLESGSVLPPRVWVGARILFDPAYAVEVKDNGETFLLLEEDVILATVN